MKIKMILKIARIVVTVAGAGLSVATAILDSKELDVKIGEGIQKALTKTKE